MSKVAEWYDALAREHGASYQASAASSQEALEARYLALTGVTDLLGKKVLDVGCGTGGLAAFILGRYLFTHPKSQGRYPVYRGIDVSDQAVRVAQANPMLLGFTEFVYSDLAHWHRPADIVLSQGPFFTLPLDGKGWADAKAMIEKMWSLTKEVLAFTAIIKWPGEEFEGWELRLDPLETLAFLHTLSPAVEFKMGYWPGDGIFVCRRAGQ